MQSTSNLCHCKPEEQLIESDNEDILIEEENEPSCTSSVENKSQEQAENVIEHSRKKKESDQ